MKDVGIEKSIAGLHIVSVEVIAHTTTITVTVVNPDIVGQRSDFIYLMTAMVIAQA